MFLASGLRREGNRNVLRLSGTALAAAVKAYISSSCGWKAFVHTGTRKKALIRNKDCGMHYNQSPFFWHRYCRPLKHATRTRRTVPLGPQKLVFLSFLKVKAEHQSAPTGIFIIQYVWLCSGGGKKMPVWPDN